MSHRIESGSALFSDEAAAFLNDPTKALNVKGLMAKHGDDASYQIQKSLVGLAQSSGFNQKEMQRTFGLMSGSTLDRLVTDKSLREGERTAIGASNGVIGLFKGRLGDIASEGGAGRRGSFEQTGFRALTMKGELGQRYAGELANRIEGKGNLVAADIMASSVTSKESIYKSLTGASDTLEDFASISESNLIQKEGRYVSLGRNMEAMGGSNSLYIPGTNSSQDIIGDKIIKGKSIQSPLVKELTAFQGVINRSNMGNAGIEEVELAAKQMRNVAISVAEEQASARGKIIGSQALAGVRRTFETDPDAFRISKETGVAMFDDLIARSEASQAKGLQAQKAQFLEGQVMTGGMWRHPTSGPESFQFAQYKMGENVSKGYLQAPARFGSISLKGLDGPLKIDVSHMTGMKGDFDNDKFVLSIIADKHTSDKARKAMTAEVREGYNQYLFNHYSLKNAIDARAGDKATGAVAGFQNLRTAKTATGKVNIALQKLKLGMQYNAPAQYKELAPLLWHLEEAAIGGKHGALSQNIYDDIANSVKTGGTKGRAQLGGVIESIAGSARTIEGSLTDAAGVTTAYKNEFNPMKAANTLMSSYEADKPGIDIAMDSARVAKGKTSNIKSFNQAAELLHARQAGSSDVSQRIMQEQAGNVAEQLLEQIAYLDKEPQKLEVFLVLLIDLRNLWY